MFCNIRTLEYDEYLLDWFGVKGVHMPKIVPSSDPEAYGKMAEGPLKGTRIAGCLGDQSAALVGQCAFSTGMAKNTYGTGCFLLYNTGTEPVISKNGLLTTVAFVFKGQRPVYALEGMRLLTTGGVHRRLTGYRLHCGRRICRQVFAGQSGPHQALL